MSCFLVLGRDVSLSIRKLGDWMLHEVSRRIAAEPYLGIAGVLVGQNSGPDGM